MGASSDTRRLVMILGGLALGAIVLCGVCGTVLLAASFLFAGQ